ncbi:hypothetical protein K9M47_01885 [Candidatus Gracilibacteria bacterium]|nr:hypothetical protein [Candidatus Gracilibacteria bacterium]
MNIVDIPQIVKILSSNPEHRNYAACLRKSISIKDIRKIIAIYGALLKNESFSVGLELNTDTGEYTFAIHFDEKTVKAVKDLEIDLWFICDETKLSNVLS